MGKRITIFLFAFLSFFVAFSAKASILVDINFSNSTCTGYGAGNAFGQLFTPTKNNLAKVNMLINTWTGSIATTSNFEIYVCKGTANSANFNTSYKCGNTGNTFIASTTFQHNSGGNQYTSKDILFNNIPLVAGDNYYFGIKGIDSIVYGQLGACGKVGGGGIISNQSFISFNGLSLGSTYYDTNYSYIAFTEPDNGTRISSGQEMNFIIEYLNPVDTYSHFELDILNKEQQQTTKFYYGLTQGTTTQYAIPSISGLVDNNYRATAFMYNVYNGVTSSPANLNFVVGSTTIYFAGDYADPIEENICLDIDISTFYGGVKCALREVVLWAFKPTKDSTIYFTNSYNQLKTSFPFSAFYSLTDTIQQGIASTTISNSSTIDIVLVRQNSGHAQFYTTPILSSSTMASTIGQSNTTLIRNSIGWLMWFAVALFVFMQFKKI
jgi:hypothetical protein